MEIPNRSDLDDAIRSPFTLDRTLRLAGQYAAFLRQAESYALAGLCEKCVNMVSHVWIFSSLSFVQNKMLESLQSSCDNSECKGGVLNILHPTHLV